jgi:tetratricopeptide (TPR) repeat protein
VAQRMFEKILELEKNDGNKAGQKAMLAKLSSLGVEPYVSQVLVEKSEDLYAQGDLTEAFSAAKKVISHNGGSKNFMARARYVQAQVLDTEFKEQSVKTSLSKVATVLAMKAERLEKAQKAYQATINYGDPEMSIKSMERLSDCYEHFAHAVRDIQIKDKLSESDLAAFKGETEKMIIPMEEKGVDSLAQALEAAKKFQMHDGTIARLQNALNQINLVKARLDTGVASVPPAVVPRFSATQVRVGEL